MYHPQNRMKKRESSRASTMAEISADDDDDRDFGDFKFASFTDSTTLRHSQINGPDFSEEEWGDFVEHPLTSGLSFAQSSKPSQASQPFDPFGFLPNDSPKPSESAASGVDSVLIRPVSEKKPWAKPRGALPLSIFGEEEEEESDAAKLTETFDRKRVDSGDNRSKVDPSIGINDIVANLYRQSQQIKADNGSKTDSDGPNLKTSELNSDSNVLHSNLVDGDEDFDDDGWEFQDAVLENPEVQVSSELLGLDVETTAKQEIQENSDGGKHCSGFQNASDFSSEFFGASNAPWQESSEGAEHTSGFHNAPDGSNDFFAASNVLWQENSQRAKDDTPAFQSAPHNLDDFFDASNVLWQEADGAKNTSGFHNASRSSDLSAASNGLWQESKGAKQTSEFHNIPDSSSDLFASSKGLWQANSEGANHMGPHNALDSSYDLFASSNKLWQTNSVGANHHNASDSSNDLFASSNGVRQANSEGANLTGFHNAPDSSSVFFDPSNEIWQENSGAKYMSRLLNAPHSSTDFVAATNGLWQENSEETKTSSGVHNSPNSCSDSFPASNGLAFESSKLDARFDFKSTTVVQNDAIVDSDKSKPIDGESELKTYLSNENVDPDENFGEFRDAFSQTEFKHEEEQKVAGVSHVGDQNVAFDDIVQENDGRPVKYKKALPLSMFSDGNLETDDSLNHQDFFTYKPNPNPRNGTNLQASNISIGDLISSLYSQSEQSASVDSSQKPTADGLSFAETPQDPDLFNGTEDFDDGSWEFEDAFSGARAEDLTPDHSVGNAHQKFSTNVQLKDYVDFYLKLKDESCFVVLCHLDSLKKAQSAAALSGENVKVVALDKEIQEARKELSQESMLSKEVYPEYGPPRNICLNGFLDDLHGQKFQVLESEYHLSRILSLAEKDLRSAVELLKHATLTLKILMLGSMEDLSNHVFAWSRLVSVCAQELKHGAFIWKQSLQKNLHNQILLEPRGQKFILSLGEIYRVVEVLGASARLFKPRILLSAADSNDIFVLLEECSTIWSSSGLEDALHCICDPVDFEYDGTIQALLLSMKHIHDLDVPSLQNCAFAQQKPICQMSLLSPELVPDMKMVVWNGKHYFLTLANLWANLISSDPPKLLDIQIG